MRVGNSAAVPKMWGLSTSSKTTFYTGDDVRFIKELLLVDKFVAQVVPNGETPITATFNL